MRDFNKKIMQINNNEKISVVRKLRKTNKELSEKVQTLQNLLYNNIDDISKAIIKQLELEIVNLRWVIKQQEDVINKQKFRIVDYKLKLEVKQNDIK